jgi:hypothetical protein
VLLPATPFGGGVLPVQASTPTKRFRETLTRAVLPVIEPLPTTWLPDAQGGECPILTAARLPARSP